jgi:hypothetical protein
MAKNKSIIIYLGLIIGLIYYPVQGAITRTELVSQISSQIGVRELTGHNDGADVEKYLKSVHLSKGNPWCAAFVSWNFQQCDIINPKSGYCPLWFPINHTIYKPSAKINGTPQPGDVFGIYFASKKRIAHVGFIIDWGLKFVTTIEGNADPDAVEGEKSREGNGSFKKKRLKRQIYAVSSWL